MMPKSALVFLCLAYVGSGSSDHGASGEVQGRASSSTELRLSHSRGRELGLLLLALSPATAWLSTGAGTSQKLRAARGYHQVPARCRHVHMEDGEESDEQVKYFTQVAAREALADMERRESEQKVPVEQIVKEQLMEQGRQDVKVRRTRVTADGRSAVLKTARPGMTRDMLECEAEGLKRMAEAANGKMVFPTPWLVGELPTGQPFIVVEEIESAESEYSSRASEPKFQGELGLAVAALHSAPLPDDWDSDLFGFPLDGSLEGVLQKNNLERKKMTWPEFFAEHRLRPLTEASFLDPVCKRRVLEIIDKIDRCFPDPEDIKPSLLHGNLMKADIDKETGLPALSNPSCVYGHDEFEFGAISGLTPFFFKAYHSVRPKKAGYQERRLLYQIYFYLNMFNGYESESYMWKALEYVNELLNTFDAQDEEAKAAG